MKLSRLFLFFTLAGTLFINACKEDEKTPDPGSNKTKSQLLIGSNWKLQSATFNPPIVVQFGMATITLNNLSEIPGVDSCQLDNLLMFNADSTITLDNGKKKCVTSDPQVVKDGNWRFLNNETQIEITNSEYFKLISQGTNKVILDQVVVTDTYMKGQTDYQFNDPTKPDPVTTKINFTFVK
jgi:hypothetical protein